MRAFWWRGPVSGVSVMVMLAALAGSASAEPTKQFPVQVSCDGVPVQYVSPMLGADAIWLVGTDGELQRYAIVYADDYLGDRLLGAHTYGVKAGYGEPLTCTHRADWPGLGTVTGTIILAPAPSGG